MLENNDLETKLAIVGFNGNSLSEFDFALVCEDYALDYASDYFSDNADDYCADKERQFEI